MLLEGLLPLLKMASINFQGGDCSSNPTIVLTSRELDEGWGDNETTTIPDDSIEMDYSTNTPLFLICMILNGLTCLGCIASVIFIIVYRKHRELRMAQPFFLGVICIASGVIATSGIVLEGTGYIYKFRNANQKALNAVCMEFANQLFGGNILAYMALFVKTWRLRRVTQLRRNQTVKCHHVLWPLILLNMVAIGVIVSWAIVAPPIWTIGYKEWEVIDEDGKELIMSRSVGYCDFTAAHDSFFIVAILLIMAISATLGYWMSRKIPASVPEQLNDGKQMRFLYLVHVVILLCFSGIYFLGRQLLVPNLMGIVTLFLVFPFSISNIALLIAPKCHSVFYDKRGGIGTGNVVVSGVTATGVTSNITSNATTSNRIGASNGILVGDIES